MRILALFAFLTINPVLADSWSFGSEKTETEVVIGEHRFVRVIDPTEGAFGSRYPDFSVEVRKGKELLALYRNFTFDALLPFDNGNYLLGLSNSGLSNFAFFIMDKEGRLVRAQNFTDKFKYCRKSVTVSREWVNLETPDIQVKYEKMKLDGDEFDSANVASVTVRSCKGRRFEVWDQ